MAVAALTALTTKPGTGLPRAGAALACALTAHTAYNLTRLRTPPADPPPLRERVSVLLPLRDEADRVESCLRALLAALDVASTAPARPELLVLDDGSTDGTADVVRRVVGGDDRVRVLTGAPLPPGWLGKPWACQQLADAADPTSSVHVFVDADVVLAPHALAATVALLREAGGTGLALVSPYPRQVAVGPAERLVQPLLQWSWLTTLPLGLAERSRLASLSAANGQLMAVDAETYRRAGGHAAVRGEVLDDLALLRAVKRQQLHSGRYGGVVDGTALATCRMYDGWPALRDGYTKSLWSAFGSPAGAVGAMGLLVLAYVVPPVAALRGSGAGLAGYVAGVTGRVLVARRVDARVWPDALAHPVSVALLAGLTARSWQLRRRGGLAWKGRPL